jgi:hypothetical protein
MHAHIKVEIRYCSHKERVDVVEGAGRKAKRMVPAVYQWCGFKSRRGKNKNLTALKFNSNTVWFHFQTYTSCRLVVEHVCVLQLSPHGLHWATVDEGLDTAALTSVSLMALKSNSNTVWFHFQTYTIPL